MIKAFLLSLTIITVVFASGAHAAQIEITASDDLQRAIDNANSGDTLVLNSGTFTGNFILDKPLTLISHGKSTIDAGGTGNGITLNASNIKIKNLTVINWGDDLTEQNAGIYSDQPSENIVLENNTLQGNGFGIWLQKATKAKVYNNKVEGNTELRSADRGNGIQLSSVTYSHVMANEVTNTRDGLYIISSQHNLIENNRMTSLRYGIHYMYSYENIVQFNYAANTRAGYALMSSKQLEVRGNITQHSEDYGFLLNFVTQSNISDNIIDTVWTKPENKVIGRDGKGVFVYNSGYNTISNNLIKTAEIGIHLTAGSEQVKVFSNSFIDNPVQVKYVNNQKQEWSEQKKGNYWSNYLGWDLNGDSLGDTWFEPNDGIDKLMWQYPEMEAIMNSPAVVILRWVQRQFPVLKPPGVRDSYPLMNSPHQALLPLLSTDHQQLVNGLKDHIETRAVKSPSTHDSGAASTNSLAAN